MNTFEKKGVKNVKNLSLLSETERAVLLARREYCRAWRKANPEKVARHQADFYLRQAEKAKKQSDTDRHSVTD